MCEYKSLKVEMTVMRRLEIKLKSDNQTSQTMLLSHQLIETSLTSLQGRL